MFRNEWRVVGFGILFIVAATLAAQPDAGQATAFAGAGVMLVVARVKKIGVAATALLALFALAYLAFLRHDPLAPVPHVEEIAVRIAERGALWAVAVIFALCLLIVPFAISTRGGSRTAGLAVAVYLALTVAASYWGNFPVPVMGLGMSPILGYFAAWTWRRATPIRSALPVATPRSA